MRQRILLFLISMLAGTLTLPAQDKAEQIRLIRQAYASAQQMVANNGKDGNAAYDVCVRFSTATEVDENLTIEDDTEVYYYFTKKRIYNPDDELFYDKNICYFIIEKWGANGHTRYREMLFDEKDGHLLFSYEKTETHAGYTEESRYYYDASGRCIEKKIKGSQDTGNGQDGGEAYRNVANRYINIFDRLMNNGTLPLQPSKVVQKVTPKADRIQYIRKKYGEAKAQTNKKGGNNLTIIIHDQEEGECPPETRVITYDFSEWDDGQAPMYRCYFITEESKTMMYQQYDEYLFDPTTKNPTPVVPIFNYSRAREEGNQWEWRYYFNERNECFEAKTNYEEHDGGEAARLRCERLLSIFHDMANSSQQ